jgi:hypothetical protein
MGANQRTWRITSLVRDEEVVGSNPATPTREPAGQRPERWLTGGSPTCRFLVLGAKWERRFPQGTRWMDRGAIMVRQRQQRYNHTAGTRRRSTLSRAPSIWVHAVIRKPQVCQSDNRSVTGGSVPCRLIRAVKPMPSSTGTRSQLFRSVEQRSKSSPLSFPRS